MNNPLLVGLAKALRPQPCVVVIFGGSGDLAGRKLLPALYNLGLDGILPTNWAMVGFGRSDLNDASYRTLAREGIEKFSRRPLDPQHWVDFERSVFYVRGSYNEPASYAALAQRLAEIGRACGIPGSCVYYLSVPPSLIAPAVEQLRAAGLVQPPEQAVPFSRIIVEKPIGYDLQSA